MVNKSLVDEIITIVKSEANNNPPPLLAEIIKVYTSDYVDVIVNGVIFKSVRCFGPKSVGVQGVLVFIDGDVNNQCFIGSGDGGGYVHPSTKQCAYEYVHPSDKQCAYEYEHPSSKQCDYEYEHPNIKQCDDAIPTKTSDLVNDGDGTNPFVTSVPSLTPVQVYNCTDFNSTYINTSGATNLLSLYKLDSIYLLRYFITTKSLPNHETEYLMNNDEIASQYRPSSDVTFHVATSSNHNAKIRINTNGQIRISTDTDNTAISLAGTAVYWW